MHGISTRKVHKSSIGYIAGIIPVCELGIRICFLPATPWVKRIAGITKISVAVARLDSKSQYFFCNTRPSRIELNWFKSLKPFSDRWYTRLLCSSPGITNPWDSSDFMYCCIILHERFALYMMCVGFSVPAAIVVRMSQKVSILDLLLWCSALRWSSSIFSVSDVGKNWISKIVILKCRHYYLNANRTQASKPNTTQVIRSYTSFSEKAPNRIRSAIGCTRSLMISFRTILDRAQ